MIQRLASRDWTAFPPPLDTLYNVFNPCCLRIWDSPPMEESDVQDTERMPERNKSFLELCPVSGPYSSGVWLIEFVSNITHNWQNLPRYLALYSHFYTRIRSWHSIQLVVILLLHRARGQFVAITAYSIKRNFSSADKVRASHIQVVGIIIFIVVRHSQRAYT